MNISAAAPWWGRISSLWLMLAPVCAAIYTLLLPIAPNDFWYNVRAGATIAQTGSIPTVALFTTSLPEGTPYYHQSWIAQYLLHGILETSGLSGIVLLRTACLTLAFVLLVWVSRQRARRLNAAAGFALEETTLARVVALSTLLVFMLSASNMDVRPQTFSVPLFAVFTAVIFQWPVATRSVRCLTAAAILLLTVLWANTHGGFFTGLMLLLAWTAGEGVHAVLGRSRFVLSWFGTPLRPRVLAALFGLCALGVLAACVNPRGAAIYSYVFHIARLEAGQKFIQEWQAPSLNQWYGALFFAALASTLLLAGVLVRRAAATRAETKLPEYSQEFGALGIRSGEAAILLLMAVMALRDIRSIIWFALFLAPVLTALLVRMLLHAKAGAVAATERIPRSVQLINGSLLLLLLAAIVPFLPQFKPNLPLPPEYTTMFAPTPRGTFPVGFSDDPPLLLSHETPVEAVEYLRDNPPLGRIWNDMVFGSYLTWAGSPDLLPHADPRVEMYPLAFWEEYGRLCEGPPDAPSTLARQGFGVALLHEKDQRGLLKRLQAAGWKTVHRRSPAVVLKAPVLVRQDSTLLFGHSRLRGNDRIGFRNAF